MSFWTAPPDAVLSGDTILLLPRNLADLSTYK